MVASFLQRRCDCFGHLASRRLLIELAKAIGFDVTAMVRKLSRI
jgi:hypothetical protein